MIRPLLPAFPLETIVVRIDSPVGVRLLDRIPIGEQLYTVVSLRPDRLVCLAKGSVHNHE